jgi:hypothetical protein
MQTSPAILIRCVMYKISSFIIGIQVILRKPERRSGILTERKWTGGGTFYMWRGEHVFILQFNAAYKNLHSDRYKDGCTCSLDDSCYKLFGIERYDDWGGVKAQVQVKLSLCFNWAPRHEGLLGNGGIAPRILTSDLDRSGQLHAPSALSPGK